MASAGDTVRRLLFLIALALFPVFLLAPAAIVTVAAGVLLPIEWWAPVLVAAVWLPWRTRAAWLAGAPGAPEVRLPIPRAAGDPLWEIADRAAQQMGIPAPSAIELMADPNAEVDSTDDGVVLRIGLPLLACCPADEIAAVVAHELSHASLGHLGSWRFEQRWLTAATRLAAGTKPGFQRYSLVLHLKLAESVLLPDRRADESEADRLATASIGADTFASALLRTRTAASAWERGTQFFFGIPRLAGLHCSSLEGLRDLAAGAARSGAIDLSDESSWSTHPGTHRRLQLAGSQASATALAPAAVEDLVLPWRDLLAAEIALDDPSSGKYPEASWGQAWQAAVTVALRDLVVDPVIAWSLPQPTAREVIRHLAEDPGAIAASEPEPLLAVAALAAEQQGLVRFDWHDAAGVVDPSAGLAAITATARGASDDLPLAPLAQAPPAEFADRLASIGVDLDRPLDISPRPGEPAIVRCMFATCKLDPGRTTVALPRGLADQRGWHAVLLNTGVALVPAHPVGTVDAYLQQIRDTLEDVSGVGWHPDEHTIWIPREAVTGVELRKRRSRVTITATSGAVSFALDPADYDPAPFLGLWGRDRVSS